MKIKDFLYCETPSEWLAGVAANLPLLLIDHANCEKKAASTALNLMYRYVEHPKMLARLSRLAREELRHFEQVLDLLQARGIEYVQIPSARYAGELRRHARHGEPGRLIDVLIISAIVEARSCERFEALAQVLDEELAAFYASLMKSEARHFEIYLEMAADFGGEEIGARINDFLTVERHLIEAPDPMFRFHSGVPSAA